MSDHPDHRHVKIPKLAHPEGVMNGLPVTRKGVLVGVITETDIFKSFLELLGANWLKPYQK
jgi:CBS domain-containing protein